MTDTPDIEAVIAARVAAAKREVLEKMADTKTLRKIARPAANHFAYTFYRRNLRHPDPALISVAVADAIRDHFRAALPPTGEPT